MQRTCIFWLCRVWYSYDCSFSFLSFLLPSFCCSFDLFGVFFDYCLLKKILFVISFSFIWCCCVFFFFFSCAFGGGVRRWVCVCVGGVGGGEEYIFISMHELRISGEGMDHVACLYILLYTKTSNTVHSMSVSYSCSVLF